MMFLFVYWLLITVHFICDYPLQGEWLAKAKNHKLNLVPGQVIWPHCLFGHASIHALPVAILTSSVWIGLIELITHMITDYLKCDGKLTYNQDQFIHISLKIIYAAIVVWSV
jgi:hypothetical protein